MRGAADTTLQKDMKETQPLVFQPLTSPFDFLTVENEIITQLHFYRNAIFGKVVLAEAAEGIRKITVKK